MWSQSAALVGYDFALSWGGMRNLTLLLLASWVGAEDLPVHIGGEPVQLTLEAEVPRAAGALVGSTAGGREVGLTGRIVVGLRPGEAAAAVAAGLGLSLVESHRTWAVLAPGPGDATRSALRALPAVGGRWVEPEFTRRMSLRADPTDPRFTEQWYLKNDGTLTGTTAGNDLNVLPAWEDGATGNGIRIAVIDDGVSPTHADLIDRLDTANDFDFNGDDGDASHGPDDGHGTAVAGCIGASRNAAGIVGPAYEATLVALRLIAGPYTTAEAAQAFTWRQGMATEVQISSNSWGPADDAVDDGVAEEQPSTTERNAWQEGVTDGRDGKGTIYVWACGNGGSAGDTCDRDGFASDRRVIAVGASTAGGIRATYSEPGISLLVNAPVGDSSGARCLTSEKSGGYELTQGTSFAAPQVAGVAALLLQVRPALTWRDVRALLATTAARNDPDSADWLTNAAGFDWNPDYGFGRVDAGAAVAAASGWDLLPASARPIGAAITPGIVIPDDGATAAHSLVIATEGDFTVESVELAVDCTHPYQGDLSFSLTSPAGTTVTVQPRLRDDSPARTWTFHAVGFLGEAAAGTWRLVVRDTELLDTGTFDGAVLRIHGYLPDGSPGAGIGGELGGDLDGDLGGDPGTGGPGSGGGVADADESGGNRCGVGSGLAVLFMSLVAVRLIGRRHR